MAPIHFNNNIYLRMFLTTTATSRTSTIRGPEIAHRQVLNMFITTPVALRAPVIDSLYTLYRAANTMCIKQLMITQTGGGRRASNYIFLLRKRLKSILSLYL